MCPVFKACEITSDFIPALIRLKFHMDDLPDIINKFDIASSLLALMILLHFPNKTELNIFCAWMCFIDHLIICLWKER